MSGQPVSGPGRPGWLRRALFTGPHVCPWWFAYTFDNRLRRLVHDPVTLLRAFVEPGQTAVDLGCGLGHFTLGLADLVGPRGRVVAIDLQDEMIRRARRRAERRGLADRVEFRTCEADRLGYEGAADFVLAFWMVHEVPDQARFLAEVRGFLKPGGRLLIAEPKGHVPASRFAATAALAGGAGFEVTRGPAVRFSRSVVCRKPPERAHA